MLDVVANCITIRDLRVGTREDMAEAVTFAAEGKVKTDIELQPLSAINDVLERLEHYFERELAVEFSMKLTNRVYQPDHGAGKRHLMRRSHTNDLTADEVIELRQFLVQAGYCAEHAPK